VIDSLYQHLKKKHPQLLAALTSFMDIEDVLETSHIPAGVDLHNFIKREPWQQTRKKPLRTPIFGLQWIGNGKNTQAMASTSWEAICNGTSGNQADIS
jgi:pantothenate kinase-related protein Tda10